MTAKRLALALWYAYGSIDAAYQRSLEVGDPELVSWTISSLRRPDNLSNPLLPLTGGDLTRLELEQ